VVNEPIHIVDMHRTLTELAGVPSGKGKPLDGLNVWSTLTGANPSPRSEVVYDIEPFRAAIRQGDWKLVWQTTLPSRVELFNLVQDPAEENNRANQNRRIVSQLKRQIEAMSQEAEFPLFLTEAFGAAKSVLFTSVATPDEAEVVDNQP
jgi:arylsulfatase A-like enzyme